MEILAQNRRYLPHTVKTREGAVKLYRLTKDIDFVNRRYHISKSSLMRWNKRYDGTRESLKDRSHKPKKAHPNSHSEEEIGWIRAYMRRNPHISVNELYGKLSREKGYTRHPGSLYRVLQRLGYRQKPKTKEKKYVPKPYDTPKGLGMKWQMDVKYVPKNCYTGSFPMKFFQYTMIDEASRERFIYPYMEQSSYSTVDFIQRAIHYFGYKPQIIQTDNGGEFNHIAKTDRIHPMDVLCNSLNIRHQLIRPRTPRHNGKVERSHRSDQERFYNHLSFYSYNDLVEQMRRYLYRSNRIPMQVLNWRTPIEMRAALAPLSPAIG